MDTVIIPLVNVINMALQLYIWAIVISAVMSWLVAFNVVNTRNPVVNMIGHTLYRITEPALRPIRNLLPNLGGIDLSPVVLILLIVFLQQVLGKLAMRLVYGG